MKLRHIVIIAIFVLVNLAIFKVLFSKGTEEEKEIVKKEFVSTLEAKKITNSIETFQAIGYGEVNSYNSLDVYAEVQGKLSKGKIELKPGVKFRKGDLLFSINDVEARLNLRSRKSAYINLLALILPDIKIDFNSEFNKWNNYVSSIRLNESLPQLPAWTSDKEKIFLASKNILSEYFSIKSLEEQLKKYYVYAPFSGVVMEVYTNDFSIVSPGSKIMKLGQTSNYEISVPMPVGHIANINVGSTASIYTTSDVLKGSGTVVRISEVINKNTQSVQLFIKPKAHEGQFFTNGEYVKVKVDIKGEYSGVRIPNSAVNDANIFIYNSKDSLLRKREINVLNENESGVFVSGLKDNEVVITQEVIAHQDSTKYKVLIK